MTQSETQERLKQIRANRDTAFAEAERFRYYEPPTWKDVDLLLSLIDGQADDDERLDVMLKKAGIQHTCHRPHDAGTTLERLARNISDLAATQMRTACVQAIRGLRHKSEPDESRWNAALHHAETTLESLTLEVKQEKESK